MTDETMKNNEVFYDQFTEVNTKTWKILQEWRRWMLEWHWKIQRV